MSSDRTSPSEFIVPYEQYMESIKNNHSIGMRFKMRFEGEEAPEQRYDWSLYYTDTLDAVYTDSNKIFDILSSCFAGLLAP